MVKVARTTRDLAVACSLFCCSPGCGSTGSDCADGAFVLTPEGGTTYEVDEAMCFHSLSMVDGCPFYSYQISDDFSEFVDIFYGGTEPCSDEVLAEFDQPTGHYNLFGLPTGEPPTKPIPSTDPIATGTYSVPSRGENGTFELYWPAP